MKLSRLGCVFSDEKFKGFSSHAQVPTAYQLGSVIRVYFAARSKANRSYMAFTDFHKNDLTKPIKIQSERILLPGAPGTFDDEGQMPSQVVAVKDKLWMYYSGWNQRVSIPYHNSTGVAESSDGGLTFTRIFAGPVLERTPCEPYLAVTPSILKTESGFLCWYISGLRWIEVQGKFEPVYVIKHARSRDGISWERDGKQVIPSRFENEAFSRPTVFKKNNAYHMFFCSRGSEDYRGGTQSYSLGHATSFDGVSWQRSEGLEITGECGPWETQMTCYPFHIHINGEDYIYYNGNGFGQSGFGLARVEV